MFFFFKQKTAYEMRISDWSSDVCSSDLDFESDSAQAAALKELLSETKFLANELESAQTAEALREIPDSYADLTKSLSSVDRQLRAHWRRLANQDFRPLIAIGSLLERIDFAADLGDRKSTRLNSSH